MFEKNFQLNDETLQVVEHIGQHMPGGFFIYRAEGNEELLYANKACLDIFGCETMDQFRQLTGYSFKGIPHPEDYEKISASIDEQIFTQNSDNDYVEYRIIRRDGSVRWVDDYGHYAETDAYGGIYYVFISDITEKKVRMESDLAVRMAVIEALSRQYNTVWLITDVEAETFSLYRGDMRDTSIHSMPIQSALTEMRYSQAKVYYINNSVSPSDRERLQKELELKNIVRNLEERGLYNVTYRRVMEDRERYFRIEFAGVDMPGGKRGVVCGFKDVDDEVREEQAIQQALREAIDAADASNKAKSDFLSSMSHDIRTPMNGIIGMTAIAATHIDDPERVTDCLKKITEASSHLLALINDVLDMNKIESGRIELREDEFDLPALIDGLLSMTRPQLIEHRHSLEVHIEDIVHEKVIGDSRRLQQVLVNLMSNAIKYTPDGGRIQLSLCERPARPSGVACFEFVFEDNGYGMTEEFLQHIFEPFSRANDKKTASIQGTGLGLAITRNIVRMMGGDIRVESRYGLGSRFTVELYLRQQQTEETDYTAFEDLHVLVADDDAASCESACAILNDLGMNSEWVLSGRAAVDRVRTRHDQGRDFYAVILDWMMPDMDGVETTRRIRDLVGEDVPIIIISAYDWSDIEHDARGAGANAFISKPLFKTKFVDLFRSLVEIGNTGDSGGSPLRSLEDLYLHGRRALLAEDIAINAEIVLNVLRMTGMETDWVQDGAAAVERVSQVPDGYYDIIFMDIMMPVMNGNEAAEKIRALDRPYAREVPIIAMTANAFEDDRRSSIRAGMNDHIAKPLDFNELAEVLQKYIH
ncbi:MAG: response regulator [Lachnospiraceae bacterium]|nr:response regulator [Lachnospiraceae bacterium]